VRREMKTEKKRGRGKGRGRGIEQGEGHKDEKRRQFLT